MVSTDLPTQEELEEAQEALAEGEPETAAHFDYWHHGDEFDDYTESMAYVTAERAGRSARAASEAEAILNGYKNAVKRLPLGIGAAALIEAVIGDARL